MSTKVNFYKIGIFVIIGIIILILLVIGLGSSKYFQSKTYLETYFNESIQGLQNGSAVRYRGITIGHVDKVSLLSQAYTNDQIKNITIYDRYIYVKIAITDPRLEKYEGFLNDLPAQIKQGLRIRIASESITGGAYLEVTYLDPQTPYFEPTWTTTHLYLPSASSTFTQFMGSIGDVFLDMKKAKINELSTSMTTLARTANKAIKQARLAHLSQSTIDTLQQIDNTAQSYSALANKLNSVLDNAPIAETFNNLNTLTLSLQQTSQEAAKTLAALMQAINHSNQLLLQMHAQSGTILTNMNTASSNLKVFANNAKEYPSQLLFGNPPPPLDPGKL